MRFLLLGEDPESLSILVARILECDFDIEVVKEFVQRRDSVEQHNLRYYGFTLHKVSHQLTIDEKVLDISTVEAKLLQVFMEFPERCLSRQMLSDELYGPGYHIEQRVVDVNVNRLRKRLGPVYKKWLVTEHGRGYKLVKTTE